MKIAICIVCGTEMIIPPECPRKRFCSRKCGRNYSYYTNQVSEKKGMKQWYAKHRESEIEINREYRKQNRELFNWYHDKDRFGGIKKIVLERDENKCLACGSERISVHHKDGTGNHRKTKKIITNNDISNLITLCVSCHSLLHRWQTRENTILLQDEDIVRTCRKLQEARKILR